jgi:hypothetical protein
MEKFNERHNINDPSYWENLLKDEGLGLIGDSTEAAGDAIDVASPNEAAERDEKIRQEDAGDFYIGE